MLNRYFPLMAVLLAVALGAPAAERTITYEQLLDKMSGFWIGQCLENYIGFPFENVYVEEPVPVLVDRVYTYAYDGEPPLKMKDTSMHAYVPVFLDAFRGAFSDDDTDIEFLTLHAVEKYGLDLTYPEIAEMWKTHICRSHIWVANATALELMDQGMFPPDTGSKANNKDWFQIDPQLVNEIWSAFYPGMVGKATERALWGARITSDDWGTHATIAYAAMISGAFFERDVEKLVQMAVDVVPNEGPFAEGLRDVVTWHREFPDWRETRKRIHEKYFAYKSGAYEAPVSGVSSLINGLCGVMAVLYGEGDWLKTVGIATSAGYDCDNQAATCGGLIGVLNGYSGMTPSAQEMTKNLALRFTWDKPFNDRYVNYTRDDLPIRTPISDIAKRIAAIARTAIEENGGRVETRNGATVYVVKCDF